MTARKRKWLLRLVVLALASGTAVGAWTWYDSPARKVRNLMNRLYDEEPSSVQRFTNWIGITKPHKKLSHEHVLAEIILIGRPALPHVVQSLRDIRKEVRLAAIDAVGELADGSEFDPLLPLLQDRDSDVRDLTAETLARARYAPAVDPLIALLRNRDGGKFPRSAAEVLMAIGDRRAVAPLTECLSLVETTENGEKLDPRGWFLFTQRMARPLARLGGEGVRGFFLECLKAKDERVRCAGAVGLGELKDRSAVDPLIESLADEEVRPYAMGALAEIGDKRAVGPLSAMLKDRHPRVRLDAASALCRLGDMKGMDALLAALSEESKDYDDSFFWRVPEFLRARRFIIQDFEQFVDHPNRYAEWSLVKLGDEAALPPLLALMKDEYAQTRRVAAVELGELGDPMAVDALIAALRDPCVEVQQESAYSLGQIGDRRAVGPLIEASTSRDWGLRHEAATALGMIGDARAVGTPIRLLDDDSSGVAWASAWALDEFRAPGALAPLKLRYEKLRNSVPDGWASEQADDLRLCLAHAIRAIEDNKPPPPRPTPRPRPTTSRVSPSVGGVNSAN